jgi:hypothetical protein
MTTIPPDPAAGFYADQFNAEERQRIADATGEGEPSLADEIAMQRVMNHRLLERMTALDTAQLPLAALIDLAEAVAQGNARMAQLLKDQQRLANGNDSDAAGADRLTKVYAMALLEAVREYAQDGVEMLTPKAFAEAGIPWPFDLEAFSAMQAHLANTRPVACDECPDWEGRWGWAPPEQRLPNWMPGHIREKLEREAQEREAVEAESSEVAGEQG